MKIELTEKECNWLTECLQHAIQRLGSSDEEDKAIYRKLTAHERKAKEFE